MCTGIENHPFSAELVLIKFKARLKVIEILLTLRVVGFGVVRFFMFLPPLTNTLVICK